MSFSFPLLPDFAQFLERDRLGLVGVFLAAASLATSDFDAERVLRLRIGFASDFEAASAETGTAGAAAETTSALSF
jgi:hypothetical protein